MPKLELGNRAYMENVTLDVAMQFQKDNPHATVFVQGMLLEAALDYPTWDFDILRQSRDLVANVPIGSVAHLYAAPTSPTLH